MAIAPIGPVAWESPHAMREAQEIAKKIKKIKLKKKKDRIDFENVSYHWEGGFRVKRWKRERN